MTRPPPHPVTGERTDLGDLVVYATHPSRLAGRPGGESLTPDMEWRPRLAAAWRVPLAWVTFAGGQTHERAETAQRS